VRSGITGVTPRRLVPRRDPNTIRVQSRRNVGRANSFAAWLALIGIVVPTEMSISIGGARFTPGRVGVILLFFPAIFILCQRGRRLLLSDLFACAIATWMIGAVLLTGNLGSLASAVAESLEFCGGYLVARAFFFGPVALHSFMRVLKILAFTSIIFAMADTISGRLILHDTIASIVHALPPDAQYRRGMVRAASTFDHAILFGAFCSLVATILLYSELSVLRGILWVGLCLFGCILSLTSAALMSFSIFLAAYTYDRSMRRYRWRWGALWMVVAVFGLAVFLITNRPLGWVLSHLTLDPQSGYFRLMIWDAALVYIAQSPMTGFGVDLLNHPILDATVDSVWLVFALRFGVPMIMLLFLTNVATFLPVGQVSNDRAGDSYMEGMRTGFTMVLVMFMFIGLTVHFWNYMWIFWGLCIGIRASLREWFIEAANRPAAYSQSAPVRTRSGRSR
jgi:hypothetical protein